MKKKSIFVGVLSKQPLDCALKCLLTEQHEINGFS